MQIQIVGREVDDERRDAILEIMSDRYCRAIIESTMDTPKSAIEIGTECGIPVSTVYRRLQNLRDSKLLGISGSITSEGKKQFLYQSRIRTMTSVFDGNGIKVEIVPNVKKITE